MQNIPPKLMTNYRSDNNLRNQQQKNVIFWMAPTFLDVPVNVYSIREQYFPLENIETNVVPRETICVDICICICIRRISRRMWFPGKRFVLTFIFVFVFVSVSGEYRDECGFPGKQCVLIFVFVFVFVSGEYRDECGSQGNNG